MQHYQLTDNNTIGVGKIRANMPHSVNSLKTILLVQVHHKS